MISFLVIMRRKFADGVPQRIFAKENHLIQTAFLYGSHEALGLGANWVIAVAISPIRYLLRQAWLGTLSSTTDRDHE